MSSALDFFSQFFVDPTFWVPFTRSPSLQASWSSFDARSGQIFTLASTAPAFGRSFDRQAANARSLRNGWIETSPRSDSPQTALKALWPEFLGLKLVGTDTFGLQIGEEAFRIFFVTGSRRGVFVLGAMKVESIEHCGGRPLLSGCLPSRQHQLMELVFSVFFIGPQIMPCTVDRNEPGVSGVPVPRFWGPGHISAPIFCSMGLLE